MSEYICPHCKRPIYDEDALLCLYCGESLKRSAGFLGNLKYTRPRAIIIALVCLLVAAFILLIVF